ncbi:MAG TPA: hypothetical protein VEX43_04130, partial [Chthoniobacterales bacterium]|nr:hypothetical protein [Chthoniobacterales bacterium]
MSDASPRLFNANAFICVEGADRFINSSEHLRCLFNFQGRIDLDQATEDGLPLARVEAGQLLEDFPYAHSIEINATVPMRQRSTFHPQIS